jgi:hypothetical protein
MHNGMNWEEREELARQLLDTAETIDSALLLQVSEQTGIPLGELIAQNNNDPFHADTPVPRMKAEWAAHLYHKHHIGQTHIRRIHYKFLSFGVLKWDGTSYENTEKDAMMLYDVAKTARYLNLIPVEAFEDHKNDAPLHYTAGEQEDTPEVFIEGEHDDLKLPAKHTLPTYTTLYEPYVSDSLQRYHIELWCEKTTINDILEPLARQYHLTVQTAGGQMSLTAVQAMVERYKKHGKPTRIFYLSDFDPSGQTMPVAMAQKIAWCLQHAGIRDADIQLYPLVLTAEQVAHYQLPRIPIKDSDKNKQHFEATFGADAVELDALEALHPGELRRILMAAILYYRDKDMPMKLNEWKDEVEELYTETQEQVYEQFQEQIDELDVLFERFEQGDYRALDDYNERYLGVCTRYT